MMQNIEIITRIVGIQNIYKFLNDIRVAEINGEFIDTKYSVPDLEFEKDCKKRHSRLIADIIHMNDDFRTNLARWQNER